MKERIPKEKKFGTGVCGTECGYFSEKRTNKNGEYETYFYCNGSIKVTPGKTCLLKPNRSKKEDFKF